SEVATVTSVDVINKSIFVTTGNINAPPVGLKKSYTVAAQIRVLSSMTLSSNLTHSYSTGSSISKLGTVELTGTLTLDHALDTKISVTRTAAGNSDYSARMF